MLAGVAAACSSEPKWQETVIKGRITVADSIDQSGDYSGIYVTILKQDPNSDLPDTLFHHPTNNAGYFESKVQFPRKSYYQLNISRNGVLLGGIGAILAQNDTLLVNAELPDLSQTLSLSSVEHEAMNTLLRVDRSFERFSAYAQAGAVPDSAMVFELNKWSNLFWDVYERRPNTIAAYLAAEKSAELLNGWANERMKARVDDALPEDYMISVALQLVKPYLARHNGFDAANNYLDSLKRIAESQDSEELISRHQIKLHFDSSRVKEARELLVKYEKDYAENAYSQEWAKQIRYDINYLAPGVKAPEFSLVSTEGDTISNKTLEGQVYIVEISPLASREYQNDLDRTIVIHEIYKNYGLKIITIPLDQNELTVQAFFEERPQLWPVARIGTFDMQEIITKFNITQVPTRLLINKNGVLIRKYVRGEFQDVIQGLNQAFRTETPS